ncbi:MAG: proteasome assembly chaperone family protein [Pseudonocardiaceae bacterium]
MNGELYRIEADASAPKDSVLLYALTGFVDAGHAGRLAVAHLLASLEHRVIARFDVDQLLDYRSRRPPMIFDEDHWSSYERPELVLYEVRDEIGREFLVLTGAEPDLQWERFTAAVCALVEQFGVGLTVGLGAVPMAVPHTRPVTVTAHASRPELISSYQRWFGTLEVPGSVSALLELRLGEAGHDAMGFTVHVPHYLARIEYPESARGLLEHVARTSGLALPTESLRAAAQRVLADVEEQISQSKESASLVAGLEARFDAVTGEQGRRPMLATDAEPLPTGDEIAAELEQFLAEQEDGSAED